jgi:RNA polymerase sigma factor (sigma-70 family)
MSFIQAGLRAIRCLSKRKKITNFKVKKIRHRHIGMDSLSLQQMTETRSASITEVVKNYGSQLLRFINSKVAKTEDAEDILQEVWFQTSRLTNLSELENVGAWLYSVTRNKIIDSYRKKKTESLEDFVYQDEDGELNVKDILLADDSNSPELAVFKDMFWKELMKALDELPEKQKRVYVQNELEDKTLQEIADDEGENIKTIISRKSYAVKHLRKRLQQLYTDLNN